ncbi:helicase [Tanacetum coccineum]
MFDESSAIAKSFRMARYWCYLHDSVNFGLRLLSDRSASKQYNSPTVLEVVALITNDFGDGIPSRDIVVDNKHVGPKRISKLHPSYMALQYPLLFSYGEDGFHEKIPYHNTTSTRKTKSGFVSMKGDTNALRLGKRIVLPTSFTMALCQAYGNPNLFITFTSNPKWPKIVEIVAFVPGSLSQSV